MARVKRLNKFTDPIEEAYFPKMDSLVSSRAWPSRPANMKMSDLNRELDQTKYDIMDLVRWDARFLEAIHSGFAVDVSDLMTQVLVNKFHFTLNSNICTTFIDVEKWQANSTGQFQCKY